MSFARSATLALMFVFASGPAAAVAFGQGQPAPKPPASTHKPAGTTAPRRTMTTHTDPALLHPATLTAKAPETFEVKFATTAGDFTVKVTRAWSPLGADRFYNLVKHGFYNGESFFRVVPNFVVQFGLSGNPAVNKAWMNATIKDDPVKQSNARGTLTFATAGPGTRTTQLFINLGDNKFLDNQGFSPFGQVAAGMDVVDKIYSGYREQPDQGQITNKGDAYLTASFPKMDKIKTASIVTAPAH